MNTIHAAPEPIKPPRTTQPLVWIIAPPDLAALFDLFDAGPIDEDRLTSWFCGLRTATLYDHAGA